MNTHLADVSGSNILIVDDNPDNLRVLTHILASKGYLVRPVPDGQWALAAIEAEPPDLILLDIRMPGMSGYEVCQQLKSQERTRHIPVIFISALEDVLDKVKAFSAGGVDYLTKPFQAEEVLARLETHLQLRRLQQELLTQNTQLQQEITERQRTEEELKQLNRELLDVNTSKDTFFSIIAHDLRSPFSGLFSVIETIITYIDHYSKEEIKELMGELWRSSGKVYVLLENLLSWSQLQQGVMKHFPEIISLDEIAEHNIGLFATRARHKQITLTNQIHPDTKAYADHNMIDMVIRNLLSNALKFTEPGGRVDVSAHQMNAHVEVLVSDSGVGMSAEDVQKLFRIDTKYSNSGTDGEKGTGLGLILCKDLIERNGGELHVQSSLGEGAVFKFTLPYKPPKIQPEQRRRQTQPMDEYQPNVNAFSN